LTPENKRRGRAKDSDATSKNNGKSGMSPFRFRSRSRSASKSRKEDDKAVKRSAEIVVNQEKLKENEIRLQEIADMDDLVRRASGKSNSSRHNSAKRSDKDKNTSAPLSTFERLRKDRDERRKRDLQANDDGGFPVLVQEGDEDMEDDHKSRVSASTKSHTSSSWVGKSRGQEELYERDQHSRISFDKSQTSLSMSRGSAKPGKVKDASFGKVQKEREGTRSDEYRTKSHDGFLQDSDVEIVSRSHSDDMSEVTDPTYMTRETREQRVRSPVNNLDTVHESSSPEYSPKSNPNMSVKQMSNDSTNIHADDVSDDSSPYNMRAIKDQKSRSFEESQGSKEKQGERKSLGKDNDPLIKKKETSGAYDNDLHTQYSNDNVDNWNPENFTGKENFVSTIDPFVKAKPSTDPFDRPFYLDDSKDDEPKQMFSFVYSESDTELDRGMMSKDTMTGISFDSEYDDANNNDGLSYATPTSKSDVTEVVKNSGNNRTKSRKQMLPPSSMFVPQMFGNNQEKPPISVGRDAFIGIDEQSGAVTLNVGTASGEKLNQTVMQPSKTQTGRLSQRALHRPKKVTDEEKGQQLINTTTSGINTKRGKNSRSPDRSLHQASSFINERREKLKAREQELKKKEEEMIHPNPYIVHREKNDVSIAIERGRRREWLFSSDNKILTSQYMRTYSPDKLKFALTNEGDPVHTRTLAQSTPRSPRLTPSRKVKTFNRQESWFEKPYYDTRPFRAALASSSSSSSRSTFKAPAVFGKNPTDGPFKAPEPYKRRTDPVLASVAHIQDPIQRAGAVILSAAAIPIQAEMRRYLAVKHREDRVWGIVVIQSYFRRWKAELTRYKYLYCATRIQAAFRGWLVRDTMEDKHYCATQIQKIARGYLATLRVYEDLYNITVVQSMARRHAAIKKAKLRLQSVLTIQSVGRGWLCRRQVKNLHRSATKIQSAWRGYYVQLNYQFDIVDIIIVQSIARRKAAIAKANYMREKNIFDAATTIQKYWRSYDCTMNYLHTVADVLVVQSVVRRWIASRYVSDYREKLHFAMALRIQQLIRSWLARTKVKKQRAARDIQKIWRGFWVYTDYVFTLADIIIVQKTVRAHQARRRVALMAKDRKERNENAAAIVIQKNWRAYSAQMEMLFNLVHIIIAQVRIFVNQAGLVEQKLFYIALTQDL
jgi:IQ calmodulin-binding motif.